jgi:SAM-dependent methyltransferase
MTSNKIYSFKSENYSCYRPSYPLEIINFLNEKINLQYCEAVADIGAGTGIFTKLLLNNGNKVFAIEPNEEMFSVLNKNLSANKLLKTINVLAENTRLASSSIDVITAAQSFHWFDSKICRKEFQRILKPEGICVFIWNDRIKEENAFLAEFEKFLHKNIKNYADSIELGIKTYNTIEGSFFKSFILQTFTNVQKLDLPSFIGLFLSYSYSPQENGEIFKELKTNLKNLFNKYENQGYVYMKYLTRMYCGKI